MLVAVVQQYCDLTFINTRQWSVPITGCLAVVVNSNSTRLLSLRVQCYDALHMFSMHVAAWVASRPIACRVSEQHHVVHFYNAVELASTVELMHIILIVLHTVAGPVAFSRMHIGRF